MTSSYPTTPSGHAARDAGRHDDTDRRHQRVLRTITTASTNTTQISVSAIARAAGVHRTYLYRHPELLQLIHEAAIKPSALPDGEMVTQASLHADLAHARSRATRAEAAVRRLEQQLSVALGHQVWADTGLEPADELGRARRDLETARHELADMAEQLEDTTQELEAARATNRELMTQLNTRQSG